MEAGNGDVHSDSDLIPHAGVIGGETIPRMSQKRKNFLRQSDASCRMALPLHIFVPPVGYKKLRSLLSLRQGLVLLLSVNLLGC